MCIYTYVDFGIQGCGFESLVFVHERMNDAVGGVESGGCGTADGWMDACGSWVENRVVRYCCMYLRLWDYS